MKAAISVDLSKNPKLAAILAAPAPRRGRDEGIKRGPGGPEGAGMIITRRDIMRSLAANARFYFTRRESHGEERCIAAWDAYCDAIRKVRAIKTL